MVRQYRCDRCATLHSPVGLLSDDPETCRACGYEELSVLGGAEQEVDSSLMRLLNLDVFVMLTMGLAVLNILGMVLGGFVNDTPLLYSAGGGFVTLLAVSYLVSQRRKVTWAIGVVAYVAVTAVGVWGTATQGAAFGGTPLFRGFAAIYLVVGLIGLTVLYGGRIEVPGLGPDTSVDAPE
jgi:hypothetical protein